MIARHTPAWTCERAEELETRAAFVALLRRTVNWLKEHRWEDALKLSTNQKERAADVHLPKGAKRNGGQTPSG